MSIDFEADTDPLMPSDEAAADYYSKIGPSETQKQAADIMSGPTALLARAGARGVFSDASAFDQYVASGGSSPEMVQAYGPGGDPDTISGSVKEPQLPPEEINKRYGVQGPDGKTLPITDRPMGEGLAALIAKQKSDEIERESVLARYQSQHEFIRNFASGTAGFLLDPLNLGSMFIPGVGEEAILGRLGASTLATRTLARFGAAGTTGAVQMGALSAVRYGLEQEQASDYDLRAAFKDMAFGAAFGAIAHAGFGGGLREAGVLSPDHVMSPGLAAGIEMNRRVDDIPKSDIDALINSSLAQREQAIKAGVSQIVEGRPVDVDPIFDSRETTAADLAQQQSRLYKDGSTSGIAQSDLDATSNRLYGPKEAAEASPVRLEPAPQPRADGSTADSEMEALEQRVVTHPNLTDFDRSEIASATDRMSIASARGDAYALAGQMLAGGERLSVSSPLSDTATDRAQQDVLAMVRAYHGTPHEFDRFDSSKIGAGEGAQAFGHGLYFAENQRIAESYREALSYDMEHGGHLLQVAIDREPEHFLDHDAEYKDQSQYVKDALRKLGIDHSDFQPIYAEARKTKGPFQLPPRQINVTPTGKSIYAELANRNTADMSMSEKAETRLAREAAASKALNDAGIAGIRYLDASSRAIGDGTRNHVVFDDRDIAITHKNGEPVATAERGEVLANLRRSQTDIPSVLAAAEKPGHNHAVAQVGFASDWLSSTAAAHGIEIAGFEHTLDTSAVRHILKRHGGEAEASRGGVPLTSDDIKALPDVLSSPDKIAFGAESPRGDPLIVYVKKMTDGSTLVTEEVRSKSLAVSSMRKYPATIDVLKDVDLYVRNDSGAPLKVVDVPGDVNAMLRVRGNSGEGSGLASQPGDSSLTVRNVKTGESVQAQSVSSLRDALKQFDISHDEGADNLQRASHLIIGDRLQRLVGDMPVYTVGESEMRSLAEGRVKLPDGFSPAGLYDPVTRHIVVLDDVMRNPQEAASLLVHEGLHGAFMRTIEDSENARAVINHLRQAATEFHEQAGGKAADHYGLTNAHEFVSEAFANPEFQRFLGSVPASDAVVDALGLGRGIGRTLWDALVAAVRRILGISPDQHSLLDATMRLGQMLEDLRGQLGDQETSGEAAAAIRLGDPVSKIEQSVADRGRLTPNEARTLIREVSERAEQMRQTGEADPYVAAARELADKVKENARKDKLDALRNAEARAQIMNRIDAAGGMAEAPEQLRSMLHGTYKSGLDSVQSQYRGLASTWMAALSHKLHSLGIEKAMISGAMDEDVAKELWAMNAGGGEGSGNKLARQAAEAIRPVLEEIKDRLNGLGARIGDATDYVATTRHDPYKMRRAAGQTRILGQPLGDPDTAFAAWWRDTQPLLAEKTFDGVLPREGETPADARSRFGRSVFDALLSGIHMTADGASGIKFDPDGGVRTGPAFEGTRNLAKKVSQERTLFWKDGAAWNSYVQRYGAQTSLAQGVMLSINQAAKQIALMERFGTNPMANLNQVERAIAERDRSDFEGLKLFQSKMNGVRNVMAYLDGSANIPANADWAGLGNNIRTFYSVADLGGVGVTHFASIWPTVSSELRHHGLSRIGVLHGVVDGLLRGKGSDERQDILSDLGAYADGLSRDMMANWQPDSPRMGAMSAVANTFMKYTGIHYVFDNTQAAVRSMLSHNLARNMGKGFGELDAHLQGMLSNYGINEREWDLIRSVDDLRTQNGRAYLTPHDALRVDRDAIEAHLRETDQLPEAQTGLGSVDSRSNEDMEDPAEAATFKFAQGLADKLGAYFSDVSAHSTVTAGARERALLLGGARAGSLSGEVMRFLTQFKMWPVAAYDQLLRREIQMSTSKLDMAWGLGSMIALSTASGYLRMTTNDWALGHPRREFDWKTGLAALAQGGGLGILGDFMFGEVNRMGGGLIGTLGGPLVSDGDELVKLFGRFRMDLTDPQSHHKTGTFGDIWPDLAHFGVRHIPFNNLVYLKGAMDYLLWYHLFEAASPGWWDRTNRRLQKEQGRTMQGYVPGGGVPTGVPYVYMKNRSGDTFGIFGNK